MLDQLIAYFETIPSAHRTIILALGLVVFWSAESILPLFRSSYRKGRHAATNLFFHVTTAVINFAFAVVIVKASDWTQMTGVGVLPWMGDLPLWVKVVAGLLVLDLIGAWLIHFLEHKVKWMWQLHLVHHSDTLVDVTTALRHHPGESVLRAVFTLLAVLVAGAPMGIVMLYQSLSALFSQFNHANMRLPNWLDQAFSWVIVSPNMHKIHHHYELPYTDSNYGNLFAFWDRIFGTYKTMDAGSVKYGLDTHPELKVEEPIGHLLKMPFEPYRPTPDKK